MTTDIFAETEKTPIQLLLVEDSPHDADLIAMMLKRSSQIHVDVDHAMSLTEAVAAFDRRQYDIIILDLGLPDSCGTESVSRLRDHSPDTPIVVLTGDDRDGTAIATIDSGAQDYLPKQHLASELLARVVQHSIARHHRLVQVRSEALVDSLTGHANRRACDAELERLISDFQRHRHPFCAALFDIDHFKQVNDRWGHQAGDLVIKAVSDALVANCRDSDHVARYGGEEFAIMFPMTRLAGTEKAVTKCRRAVSKLEVGPQQLGVTISAGYAEITDLDDGRSLFARADEALYAAKLAGRNRCVSHGDVASPKAAPHGTGIPVVGNQ